MDNFDLRKYLAENKLVKENIETSVLFAEKENLISKLERVRADVKYLHKNSEYLKNDSNIMINAQETVGAIESLIKAIDEFKPHLDESTSSIKENNIKSIGLKGLESTEALRDYLEGSGYTIDYKEGKTMFGKDYPSTISIFIKNSSPSDRLGSQHYIELFARDGKLYLYGFRSINGEEINDRWFDGSLRNETPQGGLGSSHYFGTEAKGYEISPFAVESILGDISKERAKAGKAEADFYRDRGPVSGTID